MTLSDFLPESINPDRMDDSTKPVQSEGVESVLSFSNDDLEKVKMHIVDIKPITDPETIARYDFNGDGKISIYDLNCLIELVESDTNGDGVFDKNDAEALRGNPDKADILAIWDKQNKSYTGKIMEIMGIERTEQNDEYEKETKEIKNDLKEIDWYEPEDDDVEPEELPEMEELPVLKFDALAGDINGDGKINISDANLIAEYIRGNIKDDDRRIIGQMDINDDGIIDEIDYSIAYNLAVGKEMHGVPGLSEDNPIYMVNSKYKSNSLEGEYVSSSHLIKPPEPFHEKSDVFFVSQGDEIINKSLTKISGDRDFGNYVVIMSGQPHTITVPRFTSVYNWAGTGDIDNRIIQSHGSVKLTIDDEKKISIHPIDVAFIRMDYESLYIDANKVSHVDIWGDNSIIKIDYEENVVDESSVYKNTLVNIMGDDVSIIRDNGDSRDVFCLTHSAKNLEIQNNDDKPFTIELPYALNKVTLRDVNGIPTIVPINDYNPLPLITFKGKINPEVMVKGRNGEELTLRELPDPDEIFGTSGSVEITPNPDNPAEWFKTYPPRMVNYPDEIFKLEDYDGNITGTVTISGGNEVSITKVYGKTTLVTPNLTVNGGTVTDTKGLTTLKLDGKDYIKNSEGAATYTKDGNKLKIAAQGDFQLETTDEGDNVEVKAFYGDNTIIFSGKNGKVDTGKGNDTITINGSDNVVNVGDGNDIVDINGANSIVYLNSGENRVEMNAPSYVLAGSGKDTFSVSSSGTHIVDFNPNEDMLNFSLSLGKLTAELKKEGIKYPTLLIKNEETGKIVSALVKCEDLNKINEILKTHNAEVTAYELENEMEAIEGELKSKVTDLLGQEISTYLGNGIVQGFSLPGEIKNDDNLPSEVVDKYKGMILDALAATDMDPENRLDLETIASNAQNIFYRGESGKAGGYTIDFDMAASFNGLGSFYATVKDKSGKEVGTLSYGSNDQDVKKVVKSYQDELKKILDKELNKALKSYLKEVTQAFSGGSKPVSKAIKIASDIYDYLIGNTPEDKKLEKCLADVGVAGLKEVIKNTFGKAGKQIVDAMDKVQGARNDFEKYMSGLKADSDYKKMNSILTNARTALSLI